MFEKFRQAGRSTLTREHEGTGLGLSIVRELCGLLGGEVSLKSELGRGSTFTVRIPRTLGTTAAQPELRRAPDDETPNAARSTPVALRRHHSLRRRTANRVKTSLVRDPKSKRPLRPRKGNGVHPIVAGGTLFPGHIHE